MVTDECVSFSFRMVMAPLDRASEASTRRQLESVSRISSWISSNSDFSLNISKGIKPACSMSAAPAGGDRRDTGESVSAFSISACTLNFLIGSKLYDNSFPYTDVGQGHGNYYNTRLFMNAVLALLPQ